MQWFVVRGFAVVGSTSALVQLSASAAHQPAQYNMVALRLAALLAFSAFLAQVQTISEELFFRYNSKYVTRFLSDGRALRC